MLTEPEDLDAVPTGAEILPENNEEIVSFVVSSVTKARKHFHKFYYDATEAIRYHLYCEGKIETANDEDSKVKANLSRDVIEKMVAVGTDSRPKIEVLPREPGDAIKAIAMTDVLDYIWEHQTGDQVIEDYLRETLLTGMSWVYTGWDPYAYRDGGEVELRKPDCRRMTWDPDADRPEDALWVNEESYPQRARLISMFPHLAEFIADLPSSEPKDANVSQPDFKKDKGSAPVTTPSWDAAYQYAGSAPGITATVAFDTPRSKLPDSKDRVRVCDFWVRPSKGPDGIGSGRHIVVLGDSILAVDAPSPFEDTDRNPFPYIPLYMDNFSGEQGPQGVMIQLIPLQRQIGDMIRALANHSWREAHARNFYNRHVGVGDEDINSGKTWIPVDEVVVGSFVQTVAAAPLGDSFISALNIYLKLHEMVGGVSDLDRGQQSGEVTAASAIKRLQEVFIRAVRLIVRRMERSLDKVGSCMVSRVEQFYTRPRTIRILGPQNMLFFMELSPMGPFDEMGQYIGLQSPFADSAGFDFQIKTGSSMPPDPEKEIQLATLALDRGLISGNQWISYTPFRPDGPAITGQIPAGAAPGGVPLNQESGDPSLPPGQPPSGPAPVSAPPPPNPAGGM